jgi:hypothetical protein
VRIKRSDILSGLDAEKLHAHSLYVEEKTFLAGGEGIEAVDMALQLAGKWAWGVKPQRCPIRR